MTRNVSVNPNSIDHLLARQGDLVARSEAVVAAAEREGKRDLTLDEGAQIEAMTEEFKTIESQIASYQQVSDIQNSFKRNGTGRRTDPDEVVQNYRVAAWGDRGSYKASSTYRKLFATASNDMHGFKDGHDFFRSAFGAMTGHFDPRLTNAGGSSTGEGTSGGFYMPQPVVAGLLDDIIAASTFFGHTKIVPVTSQDTSFPRFEQADRSVGLVGGFYGQWLSEGLPATDQKAKIAALNVNCKKLGIFTKATSELVSDAPQFVAEFQPALARAAAYSIDRAIVRGTGVGQPLGLLNDPTAVTVVKESGQAADTFLFVNAVKMYAAMYAAGQSRAVWVVHPSVLPVLLQMPFLVKNVASSENVGGGAAVSVDGNGNITLLGRPVYTSEHLNPVGDLGDIILVDMSQYGVFMRKEMYLETSNVVYWSTDELAFRLITRLTGLGLWEGIGQRPNSGGQESWLVMLGAR